LGCIKLAKDYFSSINDDNVGFYAKKASQLKNFDSKTFDVVFSQAVLIYLPPTKIHQAVVEMIRLRDGFFVFHEFHSDGGGKGIFEGGNWVYDYRSIIKTYNPEAHIEMHENTFRGGNWDKYGKLIVAKLR
tara:strand:- start:4759 stop:5151 length:393 start_codon:yes stop_codon:yes gene_type:complete